MVELRLARLLDASVQIADVGRKRNNRLTIDLQHQAQNAVGRRMLRTHVQHHRVLVDAAVVVTLSVRDDVFDPRSNHVWSSNGRHGLPLPIAFDGIVLAQWMAIPIFGHHDACKARMAGEVDAEEVKNLAFVEICRGPDRSNGINR